MGVVCASALPKIHIFATVKQLESFARFASFLHSCMQSKIIDIAVESYLQFSFWAA